jgi:hypothetical protein
MTIPMPKKHQDKEMHGLGYGYCFLQHSWSCVSRLPANKVSNQLRTMHQYSEQVQCLYIVPMGFYLNMVGRFACPVHLEDEVSVGISSW